MHWTEVQQIILISIASNQWQGDSAFSCKWIKAKCFQTFDTDSFCGKLMSSALTKWSQDIIFKLATQQCLSIIWTAVVKGSQSPVKTAVFIFFFGNHKLNRTHFHKILRQGFHRLCQLNNGIFGDSVTQLFSCLSSLFKVLFLHSITCKVT